MDKTNKVKSRFRMEIKAVSSKGTFEGLLSPYGNVDAGGDVVMPGAYKKTLAENEGKVSMMLNHGRTYDLPIGELELEDREDGLWAKGTLAKTDKAKEVYQLLKSSLIKGLSIGYETIKDEIRDGIRYLKEIKLYEGSVVTFPMNELAQVTSVKTALEIMDREDFQESINLFCEKLEAIHKEFKALAESEAGSTTSDPEAAEQKSEPVDDHSAAEVSGLIENIRSLIR